MGGSRARVRAFWEAVWTLGSDPGVRVGTGVCVGSKNDTKNLVRAWSWNERAIQNKIARASSRLQKKNARSQFWNAQSNFWHAGSAVELPLRRDLTKADRSISCGSCNVFCAC